MKRALPNQMKLVSYLPDEMKVSVYGKTAVVTGRTTIFYRNVERRPR